MIDLFLAAFVPAFVTLFVVIDPPGCAPIFASLTQGASARHRRDMALRATMVAAVILLVFAFLGKPLLSALGISLDAFRVAGGIMLFMIAIDMVFEKRTEHAEAQHHDIAHEDISVFPMAMPMIAGPGSIATMMLLMSKNVNVPFGHAAVLSALAANILLNLVALLAAGPLLKLIGKTLTTVITRLLGVLLAALAAQFIFDGVRGAFHL
jgi:multiple antibiotic resistance protein